MNPLSSRGEVTQAARLTPAISAAIATIGLCGPHATQVLARFFCSASGPAPSWRPGSVRFGLWTLQGSDAPSEHVVVAQIADQHFEIHCHGGLAVTEWILRDLEASGCAVTAADQWPAEHLGRTEAAAELALSRASTIKVAAVLLDQVNGSLTRELQSIASAVAASEYARAREICARLLRRSQFGLKLTQPWRLTLAGPPNVGKSSLTNTLVGAARVLVHHEPGTTRDAVETPIVISSWPLVLTDTAGVRQSTESIERQGIDAAHRRWEAADIGLLVVDATVGWTPVHDHLASRRSGATLIVLNKSDLKPDPFLPNDALAAVEGLLSRSGPTKTVSTEALGPTGVKQLIAALAAHFDALAPPTGSGVPFLAEHVALLSEVERLLAEGQSNAAGAVLTSYWVNASRFSGD